MQERWGTETGEAIFNVFTEQRWKEAGKGWRWGWGWVLENLGHKSTRGNEMSLVLGPGGNHSRVRRSWAGSLRMASDFRKTPISSRWCPHPQQSSAWLHHEITACSMKPAASGSLNTASPGDYRDVPGRKIGNFNHCCIITLATPFPFCPLFQGLPRRTSHVRLIAAWRGGWSRHGYLSLTGRETEAQELTVSAWQGKDEDPAPRLTLLGSPPRSGEGGDGKKVEERAY